MADKLIFVVTCADEKPDKATIPFALGNSALAMDTEAIIILQSTGVFLGKKDYARHIHATGFPPLQQLMEIQRLSQHRAYGQVSIQMQAFSLRFYTLRKTADDIGQRAEQPLQNLRRGRPGVLIRC